MRERSQAERAGHCASQDFTTRAHEFPLDDGCRMTLATWPPHRLSSSIRRLLNSSECAQDSDARFEAFSRLPAPSQLQTTETTGHFSLSQSEHHRSRLQSALYASIAESRTLSTRSRK
jgi:hypothetical protein